MSNAIVIYRRYADEVFEDFIVCCETNPAKRRRILRERRKPLPARETIKRLYDQKTEALRRYLAYQREEKHDA